MRPALLLAILSFATGCASHTADVRTTRTPSLLAACPLGVNETRIAVTDTDDGFALLFTTTRPSKVDELRDRVRDQARANGPGRHAGRGHGGRHSGEHDHGLRLWTVQGIRVSVDDIAAGARLSVVAEDPAKKETILRSVVRRVAELEAKGCPG
jgi:hypothetical protein